MNNCMHKVLAMAILATSLLTTHSAPAQLQGGPGTVLGSGADGIDDLVDQDVAKGYYTAEQGEQLKAQSDQAIQNLIGSLEKAGAAIQRTDSLAQSGNQLTMDQLGSLTNGEGQAQLGGTPEEVEEQAKAIYNAAHLQLEVGQAQIENVKPVIQTAMDEISKVLNARNALIQSNPNVSPTVKHNAGKESAQVKDAADNSVESGFAKFNEKMNQAQATLDNNKQQVIDQIKDAITTKSAAEGTDPTKWTKPATPAKATLPPNAKVTPNTADTQPPGPSLPTTTETYVPSKTGTVTGTSTHTTTGTVPSNQGDPALSVNRNGQGTGTPSNTSGNTPAGAGKPTANTGTPSNASNSSNSSAKTGTQPPIRISQVLTPPNVPKPPKPPATPPGLPPDMIKELNKMPVIKPLQIALPPPTDAPPNAPKDDKGITLLDKPPDDPSGNGKAVVKNAPPSKTNSDVITPVPLTNPNALPLPVVRDDQPDPSQDQANQSQDSVTPSTGGQGGQNQGADQPQNTATQAPGTGTTGVGSSAAVSVGNAVSDAAASAASDAASSAQASSQNSQANPKFIPNSPNNANGESATDSSFNAYRNNPDANPANATSQSGDVTVGPSNPNPGGFVPPNQQAPQSDAAAAAAADAAAAGVGAADSAASAQSSPPASAPASNQPSLADIQAQIASQLKAGNLGGHLVEGDEGMEGVTNSNAGLQMPAIGNLDTSVEFGGTLSVATLSSIYTGYVVTPGQNGSSVIVAGTTQVATPSSLMTAPSLQVSTPGALMTAPSMQVQFPSSVMTDPSSQVQFPSAVMVIPSSQINFPSSLMSNLVLQAALCGR
jgi:hypothetical protein